MLPLSYPHSLRSGHRLKLGVFGHNVNHGCILSHAADAFQPSFQNNLAIALEADRLGFDLLVPISHWSGLGGATNPSETCLETLIWAAGIGVQTQRIALLSTVHTHVFHPVVAAKQGASIDCLLGGRWGLNVVSGWHPSDYKPFGLKPLSRDERYNYSAEWMQVFGKLWSSGHCSFSGEYFTVEDASLSPKPVQSPAPLQVSAGASKRGREFAAALADFIFIGFPDIATAQRLAHEIRSLAAARGREIGILAFCLMVCEDSQERAEIEFERIVAGADRLAIRDIADALRTQSRSFDRQLEETEDTLAAGWGNFSLVGTPARVAHDLGKISEAGIDGVLLSWVDYLDGLRYFGRHVLPLLEQGELRDREVAGGRWHE